MEVNPVCRKKHQRVKELTCSQWEPLSYRINTLTLLELVTGRNYWVQQASALRPARASAHPNRGCELDFGEIGGWEQNRHFREVIWGLQGSNFCRKFQYKPSGNHLHQEWGPKTHPGGDKHLGSTPREAVGSLTFASMCAPRDQEEVWGTDGRTQSANAYQIQ